MQTETLFEKIRNLPPERLAEVEEFVDSIARRGAGVQSSLHEAIAAYAAEHADTAADLDPELEAAGVVQLLAEEEGRG